MTIALDAMQLVYANVEADKSPRGRSGLQTLYYTRKDGPSLSSSEVLELESRMSFEAKGRQSTRDVFFPTKSGKFAFLRFVPVGGVDRFNRSGLYFAHALLLDAESFARIDNNPFAVFLAPESVYKSTLADTITNSNFAVGHIPSIRIKIETLIPPTDAIPPACIQWLLLAGIDAKKLLAQRRTVAFQGEPEAVSKAVHAILLALPPASRALCSFDTCANRNSADFSMLWAVGLTELPASRSGLQLVSLDSSTPFRVTVPLKVETPFARWATRELARGGIQVIHSNAKPIAELERYIRGEGPFSAHPSFTEVLKTFIDVNAEEFDNKTIDDLHQTLQAKSRGWLDAKAKTYLADLEPVPRLKVWRKGIDLGLVGEWTVERLNEFPTESFDFDARKLLAPLKQSNPRCEQILTAVLLFDCSRWFKLDTLYRELEEEAEEHDIEAELVRLLLARGGMTARLCAYQEPYCLTFGVLVKCPATEVAAAHELIGILLDQRLNGDKTINKYSEIRDRLNPIDSDHWLEWAEMDKKTKWLRESGRQWYVLYLNNGFLFGLDYQRNSEVSYADYAAFSNHFGLHETLWRDPRPEMNLKGKASVPKKIERNGNVIAVTDDHAKRAFPNLCRLVAPSVKVR